MAEGGRSDAGGEREMNLLRDLPAADREEIVDRLAAGTATRIERIVSHGQTKLRGVLV